MADTLPTLFQQLYGRAMTRADRDRLIRVKARLRLSERDELWPVIMTLDHYSATTTAARVEILDALEALPKPLNASLAPFERAAGQMADASIARAVEQGIDKLSRIVVTRTQTTADNVSGRQKISAAIIGGLLALVFMGLGMGGGGMGAYFYLHSQVGICAEYPQMRHAGREICYVEP